jgi:glc operon protein GlcG
MVDCERAAKSVAPVSIAWTPRLRVGGFITDTDSYGELIACFRMDGSSPRILRHAIRKAYTSGVMHRGTLEFKKQGQKRQLDLVDWGDARLTTLQGGLPVVHKGEVVGAIGVGGNSIERDSEVCLVAVAATGLL